MCVKYLVFDIPLHAARRAMAEAPPLPEQRWRVSVRGRSYFLGHGVFVGVLIYMIEGFALRQSSVPSVLQRTLRNRQKGIERDRETNNDVRGNN